MIEHVALYAGLFEGVKPLCWICDREVLQGHGDLREPLQERHLGLAEADVSVNEPVAILVYESGQYGR